MGLLWSGSVLVGSESVVRFSRKHLEILSQRIDILWGGWVPVGFRLFFFGFGGVVGFGFRVSGATRLSKPITECDADCSSNRVLARREW